MNLIILLDRLEQMIESATEIPLTGKCLIDAEEALDLLDRVRNAIPEEVKRAEWLTAERDRVIREGQAEAERMLAQAQEYIAKMVSESEITRRAKEERERILASAREQADQIEREARRYAESVLAQLQEHLERTLEVVKRGRDELSA